MNMYKLNINDEIIYNGEMLVYKGDYFIDINNNKINIDKNYELFYTSNIDNIKNINICSKLYLLHKYNNKLFEITAVKMGNSITPFEINVDGEKIWLHNSEIKGIYFKNPTELISEEIDRIYNDKLPI